MRIDLGVATDIGRVRDGNEDAYLVEPPLYAVADGMGGARGGEVASQLALETIEEMARSGRGSLGEQVRRANRAVFDRSQRDQAVAGMGTTLTAAVVEGADVHLAHVGDSRAYLMRAGALRQLTEDHTLVNRMVKAGEITPAEAEVHPHRNVITRVLGTDADVTVDEDDLSLMDGDRVLLCSDGLSSMVAEGQIRAILETEPDPQKAADRLVRAANRAGGIDNITVVVLEARDEGGSPEPPSGARRASTLRRWLIGGAVALILLVGASFATRAWIERQWYVGVADGRVAVYQGVPAEPLGISLSHVELQTDLVAADVEKLALYKDLAQGINANDRAAADAIVEQMRQALKESQKPKGGKGS